MASYRFCRPDDIPLLVHAVTRCYDVHFPGRPPLSVDHFRRLMKELDVWPSNCMLALAGAEPVAVLVGTKRETEVHVLWIGVAPEARRRGHALHLLTSLGQKLAVLGPERLVAEAPMDLEGVCELFEAAAFVREDRLADFVRNEASAQPPPPDGLTFPATLGDLEESGLLDLSGARAWIRRAESVQGRAEALRGLAVGTPLGLEAALLCHESPREAFVDVLAAGCAQPDRALFLLDLLLRDLEARAERPLRFPRLAGGEFPCQLLPELGWRPARHYQLFSADANPA